jgi:hypothetical protein
MTAPLGRNPAMMASDNQWNGNIRQGGRRSDGQALGGPCECYREIVS